MIKTIPILISLLILNGCATHANYAVQTTGNVGRLMQMHDAKDAKKAAPDFTREALKTVNSLEYQLKVKDLE